jgi:DNA-binding HxlR family transcriptional regulator
VSPRSYKQFCALARALDVIGDRWTLLIVRNLLLGPQTWSQLKTHLPGLATNLLSTRLEQLQRDDLIDKSDTGYSLTEMGETLETPLFAIAEWGEAHAFGPPKEGEVMRLRYLFTSVRRKLKAAAPEADAVLQIAVDDEHYVVQWGAGSTISQGPPGGSADASWSTDFEGLRALLFSSEDAAVIAGRSQSFKGDVSMLERLRQLTRD